MAEIQNYIDSITSKKHLNINDAGRAFQIIMSGGATPAQIAAILTGLKINGETTEEISGAAMALRNKAKKIHLPEHLQGRIIDTCGTGGDSKGTYNISTTVAIVVAACGVPVAKHGNKAISSRSGSSDVLTALGVNINIDEESVIRVLENANICFMMAPLYHAAMRHVAPVRQELGIRTIFNVLGPLINPACPNRQLMGVYSKDLVAPIAKVLHNLGTEKAWVVHGSDGMDEITVTSESYIAELKDGEVRTFTLTPEELGIERAEEEELIGGDAQHNAMELRNVLKGKECAYLDAVIVNSGAALVAAGAARDIKEGMTLAEQAIESGKAQETLEKLVEFSNLGN